VRHAQEEHFMARDPNCIFCKIVAGQIPSAKVLETESAIAFLDINPVAPGHLLLVPKEHSETLLDTAPEVLTSVVADLPRLARAVLAATGAPGLNVLQNNGREAGQVVNHVHFHLIPRKPGDPFRVHWPAGRYEGSALEEMRACVAAAV
jgi:histidine triad (HIT) family protein